MVDIVSDFVYSFFSIECHVTHFVEVNFQTVFKQYLKSFNVVHLVVNNQYFTLFPLPNLFINQDFTCITLKTFEREEL